MSKIASQVSKARAAGIINPAQELAISNYARVRHEQGEFSYLLDIETPSEFRAGLLSCGDTLMVFLVDELATSEGVESLQDAYSRVDVAVNQLLAVHAAIGNAEDQPDSWA